MYEEMKRLAANRSVWIMLSEQMQVEELQQMQDANRRAIINQLKD